MTREPADSLIPKARSKGLGFIAMKPLCGGQYGDAELAFKFLNGFPDLVPIPGIETPDEIEEIARIVESGQTLQGDQLERAERIAAELGKKFCRLCGYCQPCPNGVPIQTAMIFDSVVKRLPRQKLIAGPARIVVEKVPNCAECGECESKCPYELAIMETIKKSLERARAILAEG